MFVLDAQKQMSAFAGGVVEFQKQDEEVGHMARGA
jgi:hypothetical protein